LRFARADRRHPRRHRRRRYRRTFSAYGRTLARRAVHVFLAHAASLVQDKGGVIAHVDVTLICERPKVAPHREAMRARIAEILGIDIGRVSVKATTTEGLGFTGRREGLAAQAVATIRCPYDRVLDPARHLFRDRLVSGCRQGHSPQPRRFRSAGFWRVAGGLRHAAPCVATLIGVWACESTRAK
jgi:hypothetical protein